METRTGITLPVDGEAPSKAADRLPMGTRVQRYIVLDAIGEGGMGTVYAAYDPSLDRRVALKVLLRERLGDAERELLLSEAKTLAKLRHSNVLAVHDVGTMPDGRLFMATDLIDGATASLWARTRTWREIRQMFVDAGRGLAAVHRAGLIHCDFKPSNVLVDGQGHACVADFGIAVSARERAPTADGVATPGARLVGTPAYMAPELKRGARPDQRSDQYAFGQSLHELLFGHRAGEPALKPPPRVPRFLHTAIARMLASDPADRFPDIDAAVRAISPDPRRLATISAIAAGVIAVGVAIAISLRGGEQPPACPEDPSVLGGTWDPPRRAAVQVALAAKAPPNVVDEVLAGLDLYARDWRASRLDACRATHVRQEQSEEALALRMDCLHGRRRSMEAMVDALGKAETLGANDPVQAVVSLPSVAVCNEPSLLRSRVRPPDSTQQRRDQDALEAQLATLEASSRLLQLATPDALARAKQLVERATALSAPHLLSSALELQSRSEGGAAAIDLLERSVVVAQAARDYERMLLGGGSLVTYLCNASRYSEADFVAGLLLASYEAASRPASLERDALWIEGSLGLCRSRPDDAIRAYSRLYEIHLAGELPADKKTAGLAAANVSFALQFAERAEEAVEWSQRSETLLASLPQTVNTVIAHFGTAWAALQAGKHDLAQQTLDRMDKELPTIAAQIGEVNCYVPMTKGALALARGDRPAGQRWLDTAIECFGAQKADSSIVAGLTYRYLAELDLAAGDAKRALERAHAGSKILDLDPADRRNAILHAIAARAHLRLGQVDAATAELALAEPFIAADTHHDERWASVALARAELAFARGDAAAARSLATEARELRAKRADAFAVAEIDELLARMRGAGER